MGCKRFLSDEHDRLTWNQLHLPEVADGHQCRKDPWFKKGFRRARPDQRRHRARADGVWIRPGGTCEKERNCDFRRERLHVPVFLCLCLCLSVYVSKQVSKQAGVIQITDNVFGSFTSPLHRNARRPRLLRLLPLC